MHPIFLSKIAGVAPDAGVGMHDSQLMNAFSLSPIMGLGADSVTENQSVWVRVGLLTDEMENLFLQTLETGLWREPVRLGNIVFAVESVAMGPQEGNVWSGRESFSELLLRSEPSRKVGLKIESPMAFKRGDLHYPLPDPVLLFGNLLRRWNQTAPFKLPELPVAEMVSFTFVNIKTVPYALRKGGTIHGVTGRFVFIFRGDPAVTSCLNMLLNFAFYAGIGVKTSQGMGMCRITKSNAGGRPGR
jgi:CRISPR-associated endoribonuclease Cas6